MMIGSKRFKLLELIEVSASTFLSQTSVMLSMPKTKHAALMSCEISKFGDRPSNAALGGGQCTSAVARLEVVQHLFDV